LKVVTQTNIKGRSIALYFSFCLSHSDLKLSHEAVRFLKMSVHLCQCDWSERINQSNLNLNFVFVFILSW